MTVSALAGHSEGNLEKKYGRQFPGITLYAAGRVMSIRDVLVHILHVRIGRIGCTGASIIRTIAIRARERVQPRIDHISFPSIMPIQNTPELLWNFSFPK